MIQAKYNIGNLVFVNNRVWRKYENKPMTVIGVELRNDYQFPNSKYVIKLDTHDNAQLSQFDEFISPIPLTPEWLTRAGFEKSEEDDSTYYILGFLKLEYYWFSDEPTFIDNKQILINGFYYDNHSSDLILIEHVHQLQNLVFALTGTELEFN